ncbi:MAG TPA: magnesium-protoporphyrin IX monomethyl ester (oxidative) cyclase, partial [Kouleothrix sp.]|nr:magnesium-protoporphyrin IX monomethyl ester (oxidative) cyclase [Kouleothrix sp.]
ISTQVYPVTLPLDNPSFFKNLDACVRYDALSRQLDAKGDAISKLRSARLKSAIGVRLLATYRLAPQVTTAANRWQGLAGFPNYPGVRANERAVSA